MFTLGVTIGQCNYIQQIQDQGDNEMVIEYEDRDDTMMLVNPNTQEPTTEANENETENMKNVTPDNENDDDMQPDQSLSYPGTAP